MNVIQTLSVGQSIVTLQQNSQGYHYIKCPGNGGLMCAPSQGTVTLTAEGNDTIRCTLSNVPGDLLIPLQ
jgi:hypothetical protein